MIYLTDSSSNGTGRAGVGWSRTARNAFLVCCTSSRGDGPPLVTTTGTLINGIAVVKGVRTALAFGDEITVVSKAESEQGGTRFLLQRPTSSGPSSPAKRSGVPSRSLKRKADHLSDGDAIADGGGAGISNGDDGGAADAGAVDAPSSGAAVATAAASSGEASTSFYVLGVDALSPNALRRNISLVLVCMCGRVCVCRRVGMCVCA